MKCLFNEYALRPGIITWWKVSWNGWLIYTDTEGRLTTEVCTCMIRTWAHGPLAGVSATVEPGVAYDFGEEIPVSAPIPGLVIQFWIPFFLAYTHLYSSRKMMNGRTKFHGRGRKGIWHCRKVIWSRSGLKEFADRNVDWNCVSSTTVFLNQTWLFLQSTS